MLAATKILCRHHSVGRRNWAALFECWLGYALHPDARRAIAWLEIQRARRQPQRLYICDTNAPSGLIQRTLVAYVRFLATAIRPGIPFCLVGKTRAQVDNLLPRSVRRTLPDPQWQPILATSRSPEYCRGLTFPMALLLDSDAYPRRGRHLSRILSAVNPCLPSSAASLLVIHGTLHPRARVNTFTNEARRPDRPIPLLDLSVPSNPDCVEASAEMPPEAPPEETLVILHIPPDDPGRASHLVIPESTLPETFLP